MKKPRDLLGGAGLVSYLVVYVARTSSRMRIMLAIEIAKRATAQADGLTGCTLPDRRPSHKPSGGHALRREMKINRRGSPSGGESKVWPVGSRKRRRRPTSI